MVSGSLRVEIEDTDASQQIHLGQIRMLVPAQRAVDQPITILNVEGEAADQCLLFVILCDEVKAVLVFGVQHGDVRVVFEGRQTGVLR